MGVPASLKAADLNRWRTPMINAASDILLNRQLFDEPATYSAEGVEMRPLLDRAWVLRARYYLGSGISRRRRRPRKSSSTRRRWAPKELPIRHAWRRW